MPGKVIESCSAITRIRLVLPAAAQRPSRSRERRMSNCNCRCNLWTSDCFTREGVGRFTSSRSSLGHCLVWNSFWLQISYVSCSAVEGRQKICTPFEFNVSKFSPSVAVMLRARLPCSARGHGSLDGSNKFITFQRTVNVTSLLH